MIFTYTKNHYLTAQGKRVALVMRDFGNSDITELDEPIVETSASHVLKKGETSSFFLRTIKGNLYVLGNNHCGQLGIEKTNTLIKKPHLINNESIGKIIAVKPGLMHTALLNEQGEVWVVGYNNYNQLGRTGGNTFTFEKVDLAQYGPIKHLACGYFFILAVTEDGQLITWGYNPHGASKGKKKDPIAQPSSVVLPKDAGPILNIFAEGTTFYVTTPNKVYASGENCYNDEFGRQISKDVEFQLIPQLSNQNIIRIMGGNNIRIAENSQGQFFAWDNVYLHTPASTSVPIPFPIKAKAIRCETNELIIFTEDHQVLFYQADTLETMRPIDLPFELYEVRANIGKIFQDDYRKSQEGAFRNRLYTSAKHHDLFFTHTEERNEPQTDITSNPTNRT